MGVLPSNPAELLFTPPTVASPSRGVLSAKQVQQILHVLDIREQLIVRLALFSGMRPGEILALQWKHVAEDHVEVVHRLYRGKLDSPKTERSKRTVALNRPVSIPSWLPINSMCTGSLPWSGARTPSRFWKPPCRLQPGAINHLQTLSRPSGVVMRADGKTHACGSAEACCSRHAFRSSPVLAEVRP